MHTNELHAVIIKDSYADAAYPLFPQEFEQTTFIDPRFAASKNVKQDLEKLNADIVLFLYNDTSTNKEYKTRGESTKFTSCFSMHITHKKNVF